MASASSLAFEEQFLCSICLHEFIEPVSTPCGHNFCKACITGYWDTSDLTQCPLCKKKFCNRPQLRMFCNEMETLVQEVRSDGSRVSEPQGADEESAVEGFIREDWIPPQDALMMIQQCDAVDVTLDAYTAHKKLEVSADGKQLTLRSGWLFLHAIFGNRFINNMYVLGKDGFSSGRFYFEVQVGGCDSWLLGVARESIDRVHPGGLFNDGYWTFCRLKTQFDVLYIGNYQKTIRLNETPKKIGVFVDYEKGEVTFYDVETRAQIYSCTGCNFTVITPLRALVDTLEGRSLSRSKLFPFLGILGKDPGNVLEITPVAY